MRGMNLVNFVSLSLFFVGCVVMACRIALIARQTPH